jgi:hypothetical protein
LLLQLVELLLPFGLKLEDFLNQSHTCDLEGNESPEGCVFGCLLDGVDEALPLLYHGVYAIIGIFVLADGSNLLF